MVQPKISQLKHRKHKPKKKQIIKSISLKLKKRKKKLVFLNDTVKEMKRQVTKLKQIFVLHRSDKGLMFRL